MRSRTITLPSGERLPLAIPERKLPPVAAGTPLPAHCVGWRRETPEGFACEEPDCDCAHRED